MLCYLVNLIFKIIMGNATFILCNVSLAGNIICRMKNVDISNGMRDSGNGVELLKFL